MNINKSIDSNYRYKFSKPIIRLIGKGGNSNTIIDNLDIIVKQLNVPNTILIKSISLDLNVSCNLDKLTINGHHKEEVIINSIYKYIFSILICNKCGIPENYPELESKNIYLNCSACGNKCIYNTKNKYEIKLENFISKYLEKNEWTKNNDVINNDIFKDDFN
ncbi:eukaryotic translation initiation factor 5 [Chlorella virus XW01]|nr:eukaryotic translation initiation factor 5 [Chlorella virus XW01]